jgi:asparagine synthase (glutamine-hydrolysing)
MRQLFGDLLPDAVVTRQSKGAFTSAFWGPATKEFAGRWSGAGVDARHVDVEGLRRDWLSERPDFRTSVLLHAAWLDAEGAGQGSEETS